jgi:c-di-GMP-binding flagellar brake protein YcgR
MDDRKTTWKGHDVSETGLGIVPTAWVSAECGQRVRVRFGLPQAGLCGTRRIRWIEANASIVRRERRKLGLRLLDVTEIDRRAIRTYVFTGSADIREYAPPPLPI